MNQIIIGKFISQRRKLKSMTQEQLAEKLGVSNKTVSKWETGRSMPDYSLISPLCMELDISIAELMEGSMKEETSKKDSSFDDQQLLDMLRHIQRLEWEKRLMYSIILIILGMASLALSNTISGGSTVMEFISGFLLGISIPVMLIGAGYAIWLLSRNK